MKTFEEIIQMVPDRKDKGDEFDKHMPKLFRRDLEHKMKDAKVPLYTLKLVLGEISEEKYYDKASREDMFLLKGFWLAYSEYELSRDYTYYPTGGKSDSISGIRYEQRTPAKEEAYKRYCHQMSKVYKELADMIEDYLQKKGWKRDD